MEESSPLTKQESHEHWQKARRGLLLQKVLCTLKDCSIDLIPFKEVRKRLHLSQEICRGLKEINLDRIRGSVGRYHDFTSAFLPRRREMRQRWEQVDSFSTIKGMPPIVVYQVGEAYFVIDGNHRVSVARQAGMKTIEAYVCEFQDPVGLSPKADPAEVILKAENAHFLKRTRLHQLRPEQHVAFTEPGCYPALESQIKVLKEKLETDRGEPLCFEDVLTTWYDQIYTPVVQAIKSTDLLKRFPKRTEADLFMWLWSNQKDLEKILNDIQNPELKIKHTGRLKLAMRKLLESVFNRG